MVVVEACFLGWKPVISGVLQGSVMGPLLRDLDVKVLDE